MVGTVGTHPDRGIFFLGTFSLSTPFVGTFFGGNLSVMRGTIGTVYTIENVSRNEKKYILLRKVENGRTVFLENGRSHTNVFTRVHTVGFTCRGKLDKFTNII